MESGRPAVCRPPAQGSPGLTGLLSMAAPAGRQLLTPAASASAHGWAPRIPGKPGQGWWGEAQGPLTFSRTSCSGMSTLADSCVLCGPTAFSRIVSGIVASLNSCKDASASVPECPEHGRCLKRLLSLLPLCRIRGGLARKAVGAERTWHARPQQAGGNLQPRGRTGGGVPRLEGPRRWGTWWAASQGPIRGTPSSLRWGQGTFASSPRTCVQRSRGLVNLGVSRPEDWGGHVTPCTT